MFREMRRKRQQLTLPQIEAVLERGSSGVLALHGDDGYPYAVPLSYVYADGKLYFHCAKAGHKMDAIRRDAKASFCVVAADDVVPEEYTTYFCSVIAFGQVHILDHEREIHRALDILARKYHPAGSAEHRQAAIDREYPAVCMLEMTIDHLTGKQAIELARKNQG